MGFRLWSLTFIVNTILITNSSIAQPPDTESRKAIKKESPVSALKPVDTSQVTTGKAPSLKSTQNTKETFPTEIIVKLQKENGSSWWKGVFGVVKDVLTPVVALCAVLISGYGIKITYHIAQENRKDRASEIQLNEVQRQLESFYRPCHQLLETSKKMYEMFRSRQSDPEKFRTLTALLEGKKFYGNDAVLLMQILEICERVENLIITEGGLVDKELQELFTMAIAHFRVIRLACRGSIKGEPKLFEQYVYPRSLNKAIEEKISRLETEVLKLKNH